MTPIGHSLTGATIAVLAIPSGATKRTALAVVAACIVAASIPDFPVRGWGHDRYFVSHSLWVTLAGAAVLATALSLARLLGLRSIPKWLPLCLALCWCSHIVLDAMYAGTPGLIVGWPFDKRRLALPVWWLQTGHRQESILSPHNLRVFLMELLTFGSVLAVAIGLRVWICRSRRPRVDGQTDG